MNPSFPAFDAHSVGAVVVGGSAGSSGPLRAILRTLTPEFPAPVVIVLHLHPSDRGVMADNLRRQVPLPVHEVLDKMPARPGRIYVAPADYHLLAERNGTFSLSLDAPVRDSRPSIDVFLHSAVSAWGPRLLAILLSGANEDGAAGLQAVLRGGGVALAQDPETADFPRMPAAAIARSGLRRGLRPEELADLLRRIEEVHHGRRH